MDLLIVLALVFLESSVYVDFPYNVVSISVVGYLTSKYELYSLPYAILIGFIMGLSGYHVERPIIFLIIYLFALFTIFQTAILIEETDRQDASYTSCRSVSSILYITRCISYHTQY